MSKPINEQWRTLRLTSLKAAAIVLEVDVDTPPNPAPASVQAMADRIRRELPPVVREPKRAVIGSNVLTGEQRVRNSHIEYWTCEQLRAWLESTPDLAHLQPAVLFPAEEITAADFGPTDIETFLRTDPAVGLFAEILFAVTKADGSAPEIAEIERVINSRKLPSPVPGQAYWSKSLVEVAARAVLNFWKATR